jgi:hypothetical protein
MKKKKYTAPAICAVEVTLDRAIAMSVASASMDVSGWGTETELGGVYESDGNVYLTW